MITWPLLDNTIMTNWRPLYRHIRARTYTHSYTERDRERDRETEREISAKCGQYGQDLVTCVNYMYMC